LDVITAVIFPVASGSVKVWVVGCNYSNNAGSS